MKASFSIIIRYCSFMISYIITKTVVRDAFIKANVRKMSYKIHSNMRQTILLFTPN